MNRLLLLLAVALLLPLKSFGCWYPTYKPQDYISYRVEGDRGIDNSKANCRLWQKMSSPDIPLDDIEDVVYEWDAEELSSLNGKKNKFAQWLSRNKEALAYLLLAKRNEDVREQCCDPWYYPCPDDDVHKLLDDIATRARNAKQGYLRDRYSLQMVRALKSLQRDEEIIEFWNSADIREPLIKRMILGYVGGAYYDKGQYDKALSAFVKTNDLASIIMCLEARGESTDILSVIETTIENGASNEMIVGDLRQYVLNDIENSYCDSARQVRLKKLVMVCRHLSSKTKPKSRTLWKYTEAYCYWMQGNMKACKKAIGQAERLPSSKFMAQSIHVLRLLVDAKTLPINADYDKFLYAGSRWLLRQANAEIRLLYEQLDKDVYRGLPDDPFYVVVGYENVVEDRNLNYSDFYFADMFRKVMMGQAAPRLIKAGNTLRALQLVDMGDNILLPDSVIRAANNHGGATFAMADTLDVNAIIQFTNHLRYPKNRYDKFYGKHGSRCNMGFWYDLIGTMMLRKGRYDEAVSWLKTVPSNYYENTKVKHYFWKNPFAAELVNAAWCRDKGVIVRDKKDYKLNFAKKMSQLRRTYLYGRGKNKRAYAKFQFAVGMHNSVYPCWALTHHYWGGTPLHVNEDIGDKQVYIGKDEYGYDDYKDVRRHQAEINRLMWTSARLMKQSLAEMTDKELLAKIHWTLGNYKTVKHRLGNTQFALAKQGRCDRWKDY